ncbi:hypothetical protein ACVWYN_001264 [Pedobacter sp. UYP24]
MQIVHVILVHKNPWQVKRLVASLSHTDSLIFLHVDKKVNIDPFKAELTLPNVHFVKKRVSVNWGGFSQIEAVINSFKELIEVLPEVQYVNLLSGQDYPIKCISRFHKFLDVNPGYAYMEFQSFEDPWVVAALERFNKYHFSDTNFLGKFMIEKLITALFPKRVFPENFKLAGRSQWFTIDGECLNYILYFISNKKSLYRKFKYSWGADELVFQTILYNSHLKDKLVNNNLRYIDWSDNQSSPKTITIDDKTKLIDSTAYFARKFDINVDEEILDFLDEQFQ